MRFLFAPDSFKGSLSAAEVCALLISAANRHFPEAETRSMPIADGGEGTVDALVMATGGHTEAVAVTGPMGTPVEARIGILGDGETAVIEMAQASGLPLVPPDMRDPLAATSLGTGELIRHALARGFRRLLIGIGGSATNDGGMGMLTALGARFADASGNALHGSGAQLAQAASVSLEGLLPALRQADIAVMCDVTNPLLGEQGATYVYGPQKGAGPQVLPLLERGMARYAALLEAATGRAIADIPGAGAAGGVGAALAGVLGASMRPGIDAVLDASGFDIHAQAADLVVTGEGRIDGQSIAYGKAAAGVAKRCAKHGVPVVALVGGMAEGAQGLYALAESGIMTTINAAMDVQEAMRRADALAADAADRLFRLLKIGTRIGSRP